jgi:hypothetical protein
VARVAAGPWAPRGRCWAADLREARLRRGRDHDGQLFSVVHRDLVPPRFRRGEVDGGGGVGVRPAVDGLETPARVLGGDHFSVRPGAPHVLRLQRGSAAGLGPGPSVSSKTAYSRCESVIERLNGVDSTGLLSVSAIGEPICMATRTPNATAQTRPTPVTATPARMSRRRGRDGPAGPQSSHSSV